MDGVPADEVLRSLLDRAEAILRFESQREASGEPPDREMLLDALQHFDDEQLRLLEGTTAVVVRQYRRISGAVRAEQLRRRKRTAS